MANWLLTGALAALVTSLAMGSSDVVAQTYEFDLESYDRVSIAGYIQVELLTAADRVTVWPDTESLADKSPVTVEVIDSVLYIRSDSAADIIVRAPVRNVREVIASDNVRVTIDEVNVSKLVIEAQDQAHVVAQNIQVEDLLVVGRDSARISMHGVAAHQFVELDGAPQYWAPSLASDSVQLDASGNGRVAVWAKHWLGVQRFGNFRVSYAGGPDVFAAAARMQLVHR